MCNRNHEKTVNRLSAEQFGNFDGVLRRFEQAKKFKCCHKAAEQGDTHAQLHLGWCYAKGEGIRQDYAKAVRWFRMVAEQGDARAQLNLGICHARGLGIPQDYEEAAIWFLRAAEQGLAEAQNNLGVLYMTGQGVYLDYERGLSWLHAAAEQANETARQRRHDWRGIECLAAAEQGLLRAIYNLFLCYTKGIGVRQDSDEAYRWVRKALEVAETDRPRLKALIAHRRSGSFENPAAFQADPRKG